LLRADSQVELALFVISMDLHKKPSEGKLPSIASITG
jgi:hypothetical protein